MRFCIEDALAEGLKPFSVASLANTTTWINNNCPGDILRNNTLPLAAAISLTTGNPSFVPRLGPWTTYAIELVLERLIDFKLPLLVLILQVAFAPLGLCELACALLHLMINPGDSISSYMFTLADCHALLERVREVANGRLEHASAEHKEELCRVLTLILIAYSTSGRPISDDQIEVFVHLYANNSAAFRKAAQSLATDRTVSSIPMAGALFGFVMAILFKYLYIDRKTYDEKNPQHIQIWSLSSSMVMIWPIVAVYLASIIGAPKTADSTNNILGRLETDEPGAAGLAAPPADDPLDHGAMANFRPDRWSRRGERVTVRTTALIDLAGLAIMTTGSVGAVWLAARVPPEGWNCRTADKLVMFAVYLVIAMIQQFINRIPPERLSARKKMYLTAAVDIPFFLTFAGIIFITQFGVLNRVGCYAVNLDDGVWGVLLPPFSWPDVQPRLGREYAGIVFGFLALQFVICIIVGLWFRDAARVYRQPATRHWRLGRAWTWLVQRLGRAQGRQEIPLRNV